MSERIIRAVGKDFSPIENVTFTELKNGLFEQIESCSEMLEAFLDTYGIDLRFPLNRQLFGKYVGVLRNKKLKYWNKKTSQFEEVDFTLQLDCRFDGNDRAWFLGVMLLEGQDDLEFKDPAVHLSTDMIFDILLFWLFRKQLEEAAKKGIFRSYRRFECNNDRPRGVLNIPRHIRLNADRNNGRIAYSYREHTENNSLNRLIAAAYRRLKERFFNLVSIRLDCDPSLSKIVTVICNAVGFDTLNSKWVIQENLRPITHPFFHEYDALRKTCLKILRYEGVSVFDADCCEETESLLEDVTKLWERFLGSRISKLLESRISKYSKIELKEQYEHCIFDGRNEKAIPDLVFCKDYVPFSILDAKFKCHWNDFFNGVNSDRTDYLDHDINKCIRDMVVFKVSRTGVIFPAKKEDEINKKSYYIGSEKTDASLFDMVRVQIPEESNYDCFADWKQELDNQVNSALKNYFEEIESK